MIINMLHSPGNWFSLSCISLGVACAIAFALLITYDDESDTDIITGKRGYICLLIWGFMITAAILMFGYIVKSGI